MAMESRAGEQPGTYKQSQRAGFVELLFDVVFVFAFTRLSDRMVSDLSWRMGYATFVLTLALWWVWYRLVWATNRYDSTRPAIQIMVIGTTLGSLLMAIAVPEAYGDSGFLFAGVYVAIQTIRPLWIILIGTNTEVRLVSVRILFWALISAIPWIAGAFTQSGARLAWWSLAVALDYLAGVLDYPTPRLGRARFRADPIQEDHLTERYRQLLIIALGETILISGIQISPHGLERDRVAALLVSFAITVLLWQIYFYRAGELLAIAIASAPSPAYVGRLASYAHLAMITGVGLTAVGDELIISHPLGHTERPWVLVILGGPAVFLIGRALLDYVTFSHVSWSRPIGLLTLAAVAPVTILLPPILVAVTATAVLTGVAISNVISWRLFPRVPKPAAPGQMSSYRP
ncbi:Low temperature requirement protein LtrA [Micromonospora echinaurantiaca]|uniref:Low temperature requirement protein LtrA n=1 Tax=Micromonospora echinaurantiaca TaxID=47857 RepID=A0A1C5J4G7_9ACTN|nr:low temperature requirement protein A [Micromonospora echinaurantiaca]SCG65472.1 Low temperature requirement protein LtrA [Micromonospora echinaurantiaca]